MSPMYLGLMQLKLCCYSNNIQLFIQALKTLKIPLTILGFLLSMDPAEKRHRSEALAVGQVSHHSIELVWSREKGSKWTDPPQNWTCFILEQMNNTKHSFKQIHKGYNTRFTVDNLEPKTTYTFRLKVTWPSGQQQYYPSVTASTEKPPLNGKNLHSAVLKTDEVELCRVLQSGTVTVDVPDRLDYTPLMMAAIKGFTSGVQILVHHGADVSRKNSSGKDSLMLACFHGHLDVVKLLCGCGASWRARDRTGCCSLHWATAGGQLDILQYLIQYGCEVNVQDNIAWTPLMIVSVITGDPAVASLLISAGADVNVQDRDGKTPLMVAVLNNYEHLVQILLKKGADPNIQNKCGVSALEMAKAFDRQNIISLLEDEESERPK
ncbi:fibronectin type 3 and ankyrin repeat domains protein 1 isoform X1 [Danio rerio]|uniref:Fibronectin type 3 and ankyrin repeat domains protein 1 isoform X1 n=3 Tax=Danio rerio TaxID=7955 RepID=A0ACD6B6P4_DANRE|nr:fibronectin type 3 and ankyrin repeat domains protein 1 [Danio rerio]|eukprot:XP_002664080.5 fibronectin type 3 and ankyrin repeat domains protein 1 [Danio rerio]